jgi:hypothetical protein
VKPRPTHEKRRKEELRKARQNEKAERRASRKQTRDDEPESPAEISAEDGAEPSAPSSSAFLLGNVAKIDEPDRVHSGEAGGVTAQ